MSIEFGSVTIDCPGCHRRVAFPIYARGPVEKDDGSLATELTLDMDAVTAHLLTHGPHDGEPKTQIAWGLDYIRSLYREQAA